MKSKAAVKAAARTLGVSELGQPLADKMLGLIQGKAQLIQASIDKLPEVKNIYDKGGPESDILKNAIKIENLLQNVGVHAAGIVISENSLAEEAPLFLGKKGEITTQYEMRNIEEIGLVKFDFLGLRTLSKIKLAQKLIKKYYHKNIDIYNLDIEDDKVYQNLRNGDVVGVFQLEAGSGMRDLLGRGASRFLRWNIRFC
jgi:DNA polymerase-3 subunit alpha